MCVQKVSVYRESASVALLITFVNIFAINPGKKSLKRPNHKHHPVQQERPQFLKHITTTLAMQLIKKLVKIDHAPDNPHNGHILNLAHSLPNPKIVPIPFIKNPRIRKRCTIDSDIADSQDNTYIDKIWDKCEYNKYY